MLELHQIPEQEGRSCLISQFDPARNLLSTQEWPASAARACSKAHLQHIKNVSAHFISALFLTGCPRNSSEINCLALSLLPTKRFRLRQSPCDVGKEFLCSRHPVLSLFVLALNIKDQNNVRLHKMDAQGNPRNCHSGSQLQ